MIKIMKLIKIFVKIIIVSFLICIFTIIMLLCILRYNASRSMGWGDIERYLYMSAGCNCRRYPPSMDWIECVKIEGAWKYLRKDKIQKITFCKADFYDLSPENWGGWDIVEPEKINKTIELIDNSEKRNNMSVISDGRMKIITDKHKFIIPILVGDQKVHGYEWSSAELREKLKDWGYGSSNDANNADRK